MTILSHWYFHLPNYLFAVVIYTLLGRFILAAFVPADWDNYIWRAFVRLTQPAVIAGSVVTPAVVRRLVLLPVAAIWVYLLRLTFGLGMIAAGLAPTVAAP
ncbi:MAG: hypothetical protein WD270_00370 [Acetobacterales bacterium]